MKVVNGIARFDLKDDADVASLVANGLIWKGGAQALQAGVSYLQRHPEAVNAFVPAQVTAALKPQPHPADEQQAATPPPPVEPPSTPSDPSDSAEAVSGGQEAPPVAPTA